MAQFKVVINDVKRGKSFQKEIEGQYANSLIGKKIGETVDGIFVDLPGYKLEISGGSDQAGTPMRKSLPGARRRKVLVRGGVGFHPTMPGQRRKKTIRGNTIGPDIVQVNMKITKYGPKSIEDLMAEKEENQ